MRLAMVGLGKMGSGMSKRLLAHGHEVVVFDTDEGAVRELVDAGATGASSLAELVNRLDPPRFVWLMLPLAAIDGVIAEVAPRLAPGDGIIDGGNTLYRDTLRRAEELRERGIHLIDAGTSGGVWGEENGFSLMVGGSDDAVAGLRPALEALAPGPHHGWGHVGPTGAGHFTKMIHNGIEYGLMQAYAEGFAMLQKKEDFGIDLHQVAEIWRHGSVVRSWLLDLTANALAEDPDLDKVAPWVDDSGEGRWTVQEAVDLAQSAPTITMALFERFRSRDERGFSDRLLASLRNQFGGHAVREAPDA